MFNVDHISFSINDVEETITFYKLLGFEVFKSHNSDIVDLYMLKNKQDFYIELFYYHTRKPLPDFAKSNTTDLPVVGTKHFGLCVKDIEEAKSFVLKNKISREVEIITGRLGRKYFMIKDPNGILIEIIEDKRKKLKSCNKGLK